MINTLRVSILLFLILFVNIQNIVCQPEESNILISRFSSVSPELSIHKVLIDDNNTFWLASNKGLIETNAQGSKFVTHFESTSFVYLTSDMKDNIWASSRAAAFRTAATSAAPRSRR